MKTCRMSRRHFSGHIVWTVIPEKTRRAVFDLDRTEIDWQASTAIELWERVYSALSSGEMPPSDADQPSAEAQQQIVAWLRDRLLEHDGIGGTGPRRLNRQEYQNTIRELFDLPEFVISAAFPADDSAHGFDNVGQGLILSPPLMAQYVQTATSIADEILPPATGPRKAVPKNYEIGVSGLATSEGGRTVEKQFRLVSSQNMASIAVWPSEFETPESGIYRLSVQATTLQTDQMFYDRMTSPLVVGVYARKKTEQVYDRFDDVRKVGTI